MKTKITFTTFGISRIDIERRAIERIAEFLDIEKSDVETKCDIEIQIEADNSESYIATVFVRVK